MHSGQILSFQVPGWRLSVTALLLLACMICVGWMARRSRLALAVVAMLSVVWLTVDSQWEITLLVPLGGGHGVTLADLAGIAGLAVSIWLVLQRYRRRGRLGPPVAEAGGQPPGRSAPAERP